MSIFGLRVDVIASNGCSVRFHVKSFYDAALIHREENSAALYNLTMNTREREFRRDLSIMVHLTGS